MHKGFTSALLVLLFLSGPVLSAEPPAARDYQKANELVAGRKYREAIALYRGILAAPPPTVAVGEIHARIGDACFKLADYRGALEAYRRAIRDPKLSDKAQTQYWIGFCAFLAGRDAEAVDELLKVAELYPGAKAWGATSYYWAGRASERMGRKEEAAEYYRRAAGGSPRTTQGKFAMKKAEAVKEK
jgi:tetratricopeptide (TPR) repeat protein